MTFIMDKKNGRDLETVHRKYLEIMTTLQERIVILTES